MATPPHDDPLLPWLRSIRKLRESHPNDKSKLLPCLADCFHQFGDDERYRNDLRFLRVCIRYADCSPENWKVMSDIEAKKIGQEHAVFYEAYATCLEAKKRFGDADATYKRGLSRQARPAEKLLSSYKLFVERMEARKSRRGDQANRSAVKKSSLSEENLALPRQPEISLDCTDPAHGSKAGGLALADRCKAESNISIPERMPVGSFSDETIQIRNFAAGAIIGKETDVEDARHHGLVDPTINTKEALQDILSMFHKPMDIGKFKENAKSSKRQALRSMNKVASNVTFRDSKSQSHQSSSGLRVQSAEFSVFRDSDIVEQTDRGRSLNDISDRKQESLFSVYKDECCENKQKGDGLHCVSRIEQNKGITQEPFLSVYKDDCCQKKQEDELNCVVVSKENGKESHFSVDKEAHFSVFEDEEVKNKHCPKKQEDAKQCKVMSEDINKEPLFFVFKDEELQGHRKRHQESDSVQSLDAREAKMIKGRKPGDVLHIKALPCDVENTSPCVDAGLSKEVKVTDGSQVLEDIKITNSMDNGQRASMLQQIEKLLITDERYHRYSKGFGAKSLQMLGEDFSTIDLGKTTYNVKDCTKAEEGILEYVVYFDEDSGEDCDTLFTLKVETPACPWEFYICAQLDQRIPAKSRRFFQHVYEVHIFTDCSMLLCNHLEHGSLQELLDTYQAQGQYMHEVVCLFYTLEMLTMLEVLHSNGFIHGNIIPRNLLLRNHSESWEEWTPNRPGCWRHQGLLLIDWSQSVDTSLWANVGHFQVPYMEMTGEKPWSFMVDTYEVCRVVHLLLMQSPLEVRNVCTIKEEAYNQPVVSLKCKNAELWNTIFMSLLNAEGCEYLQALGTLREAIEQLLNSTPSLTKELRIGLMKQNIMMTQKRSVKSSS